jgi:5-methyltetrahydropteroyltriglutamate--homocysteine methyltransferase
MADRILTTHAGSLPRPADIIELMWAKMDGQPVEEGALDERLPSAVDEIVERQRKAGIDIVSDGELSKPGFSTYVNDRFSGFDGRSEFQSDDVAPFPDLAMRLFATDAMAHVVFSNCVGPVELIEKDAIHRDIANLKKALDGAAPETAFMGAISPGQIAFNYPNHHYSSHEEYLGVLATELAYEYKAIIDAGLNLQIDSPDLAMAAHSRSVGSSITSWEQHLPLAIEAINAALEGIPKDRVRLHLCWGNYAGPHHCDVPLQDIIGEVIKANVGTIYPEGANARHEHEWRVFRDVKIPDDMKVILGVIDVKSNYIEHPQVVADRLVRVGRYLGTDRLLAGTDCGFDTFIKFSQVDPEVAWHKLNAMSEGAALATKELSGAAAA